MRKFSSLLMGLVAGGSILAGSLAGGVASADERVRVVERREVVREPRRVEVVRRYPDRAPPEAPREAEGRWGGHVWVGGGYDWINGRYIFVPGHYVAERRGYHWVSAEWARHGHRYVRAPGHWAR